MKEVRNILIGLELKEAHSQLTYYDRKAREVVSMPLKVGTNIYHFPTKLVKLRGRDEWHYGMEAEHFQREGAIAVTNPVHLAKENRKETVDGTAYEAWEILAIYLKEVLKLFGLPDIARSAEGICITTEVMTAAFAANLKRALRLLGFDDERILLQDFKESFYYYCYSQKPSVWTMNLALVEFDHRKVSFYSMVEKQTEKPHVVTIQQVDDATLPEDPMARDSAFSDFLRRCIGNEKYSGIFITGSGFEQEWAKQSIRVLVENGRHVYEGDNLYVKGACYALLERMERHAMRGRLYLGPDLVETNVTIDLIVNGAAKTCPLIQAGRNWFENSVSFDLILDGRQDITVTVTPMAGNRRQQMHMALSSLPERPNRTTRIRLSAECTSAEEGVITAEDLGFGELFPATHQTWTGTVRLMEE